MSLAVFVSSAAGAQTLALNGRVSDPQGGVVVSAYVTHRIGLNYVYLEPADARIVRSDRFSDVTVGTQAILLMYPLHFGRFGGRWGSPSAYYGVMVLYVVIGVAPFVLMVTGLLMYWNRSFSKKWRRFRARSTSAVGRILPDPALRRVQKNVRL